MSEYEIPPPLDKKCQEEGCHEGVPCGWSANEIHGFILVCGRCGTVMNAYPVHVVPKPVEVAEKDG